MVKSYTKGLGALLLASLLTVGVNAATVVNSNNIRYESNSDNTGWLVGGPKTGTTAIGDIVIKSEVTSSKLGTLPVIGVKSSAFQDQSEITSISLPESVKTIGDYAFMYCENLTKVEMAGVTSIGNWAFVQCNITDINFPEGLTSIGNCSFDKNKSLQSVVLPSTLTNLGGFVFEGCDNLTSITIKATTPPAVKKGYINDEEYYTIFEEEDYSDYAGRTLYVPAESIEDYKVANGYWQFKENIKAIEEATDGIATVGEDDADAPVEYFNIQGVRVDNPVNGLYIRRQGRTVSKVVVR